MEHDNGAFRKRNRDKLVAYFASGEKYPRKLGFELEHILLRKGTNAPVSYSEPRGVKELLERLAPHYDRVSYEAGNIVALTRSWETITIEPAGQLEFSAGPFVGVEEVERAYLEFRNRLDPILEEFDIITPMLGYNPSACARDLELIPKFRYRSMSDFLGAQIYADNYEDGIAYFGTEDPSRRGLAIEPQDNTLNREVLRPVDIYRRHIVYHFEKAGERE